MPTEVRLDVSSAISSNMTDTVDDVTVDTRNTDGVGDQDETEWQNTNWSQYFGYYKTIPECKIATDTLVRWTIGDGYIVNDPKTEVILDHISGWGTDTFDDILENMDRTACIGGDSFAEIIRDDKGNLINLKPLDPSTIKIIVGRNGIIKRYEQISKVHGKLPTKFRPEEMFHLSNRRIADEIHGISDYEAIEQLILANKESFDDMKKLMHRHVKPIMAFKLDTDDQGKINTFMGKMDEIINKGENIYIPKGSVEFELVSVPSNSTLNPIPWREHIRNYFYQVCGIPQILMGGASEFSESSAKISYLSFEQTVKQRQRYLIMQVWNQLFLRIDLAVPASLRNEMLSDEAKDGTNKDMAFQPNDLMAGVGA